MTEIPRPLAQPLIAPSYSSGRHEYDGLDVLDGESVADLKDCIWGLFFGGVAPLYYQRVLEKLAQASNDNHFEWLKKNLRSPQEIAAFCAVVIENMDLQRQRRAIEEEKERKEYERLRKKFELAEEPPENQDDKDES